MLTSPQIRLLHRGLLATFSEHELEALVRVGIGVPIERLVPPGSTLAGKAFEIIQAAERAGWTPDLVRAAYEARPVNTEFAELYQALGLATAVSLQHAGTETSASQKSTALGPGQLTTGLADIAQWRERLATIEACVCRVEVGTSAMGTGFLVGPDLVLTAYHVVAPLFTARQSAKKVRFRFDYRVLGGEVAPGVILELHPTAWDIDYCPYGDEINSPASHQLPTLDQLDYALLRLARSVGMEPRDPSAGSGLRRGWLPLPVTDSVITAGMPLAIAQYASGGPLKIAVDTNAVLGLNENHTRIRYATNTEPGAGGAPCFDASWELVAIHQGAQRALDHSRLYGEGIPISAIRNRLLRVGKAGALAAGPPPVTVSTPFLSDSTPPMPGTVLDTEDIQKGRWGGLAERNGRELVIKITDIQRSVFTFDVHVTSTDGSPLRAPVIVHLHDTYTQPVIPISEIREERTAVFSEIQSYRVYTIGVQVKDAVGEWLGLELDLRTVPDLPSHFHSK